MTNLNTVYKAIGGLQAQVTTLVGEQSRSREKLDEISTMLAKHADMPKRLAIVETEIEDFRVTKKFVRYGMAAVVGLIGAVGGLVASVLGWKT